MGLSLHCVQASSPSLRTPPATMTTAEAEQRIEMSTTLPQTAEWGLADEDGTWGLWPVTSLAAAGLPIPLTAQVCTCTSLGLSAQGPLVCGLGPRRELSARQTLTRREHFPGVKSATNPHSASPSLGPSSSPSASTSSDTGSSRHIRFVHLCSRRDGP